MMTATTSRTIGRASDRWVTDVHTMAGAIRRHIGTRPVQETRGLTVMGTGLTLMVTITAAVVLTNRRAGEESVGEGCSNRSMM
jgi:hypothetical protein